MLNTIKRTGALLALFTPARSEWGATEAAAALGVAKSNVHDLMTSLAAIGLLQRTDTGRYRLGWRLVAMSRDLMVGAGVQSVALPVMRELAHATGQTVQLSVWDDGCSVVLARAVGPKGIASAATAVGRRLAPHCTASGKLLLAQLGIAVRGGTLERFTEKTITEPAALGVELAEIRRDQTARDRGELLDGVACVAVPVRDQDGQIVSALSITASPERIDYHADAYLAALDRTSRRMTQNLRVAIGDARRRHAGGEST